MRTTCCRGSDLDEVQTSTPTLGPNPAGRALPSPHVRPRGTKLCLGLALLLSACAAPRPECRLTPFVVGRCSLGADHVLGAGHDPAERLEFAIYAFLVEGPGGERALIDLGPVSLEYTNAMFRRFGFFRDLGPGVPQADRHPDDIVQPRGNVLEQLDALNVAPESIGHIVFTHLHADHHGMDDATKGGGAERFPRALLHVSRKGWEDNLARRVDGRWGSYVDFAFSDFLAAQGAAGRARFEDDAEVFPGLRTMHLGGHSVCSQAVVVETRGGPAIITSDEVYLYDLLEDDVLPAIRTSVEGYGAAIERLVEAAEKENAVLLPLHDPALGEAREAAGEAWLERLRPRSERAIEGYRRAHPRASHGRWSAVGSTAP